MIDFSKISAKNTAIIFSCVIASFVAICSLFLTLNIIKILSIFIATLGFTWALLGRYLVTIVDKKIKILYKSIYTTKNTKRQQFYNDEFIPKDNLIDVEKKIAIWAQEEEKLQLIQQQNEEYRKQFFQNMSHELKTPIFAIQGYLEILEDGGLENTTLAIKYLQNSRRNIERLSNLVLDMDEISKLESGDQPLYITKFDIYECMVEAIESLSSLMAPKRITYNFKKDSFTRALVFADKQKIKQVLTNLYGNAIKYGRENGYIQLAIYKPDDAHYLIEVSDNGYGIAEKHLSRIFERFYRTDTTRSRNIGGSGLGLSICKHIIEAHQQIIHARSAIDLGSTFSFTLDKAR